MNSESLRLFAILATPFVAVFLIEGITIYSFKLKRPLAAVGVAVAVNIVSFLLFFYAIVPLLGKLNYEINGLNLPLQLVFFLWWFSAVAEGMLLRIFLRRTDPEIIFKASMLMNALSTSCLYFFIVESH
ncbi:MAG TPA: hypothetical protein VM871_00215 [Flavisolibacter sp.]|jgi:hypothetical protein|nr:hypothetical protein [Flavisolibacter sp.]